jgi:hypothetical protein
MFLAGFAGRMQCKGGKQWQALPRNNNFEIVGMIVTILQQCQSGSYQNLFYVYRQRKKMRKNFLKKMPANNFLLAGKNAISPVFAVVSAYNNS